MITARAVEQLFMILLLKNEETNPTKSYTNERHGCLLVAMLLAVELSGVDHVGQGRFGFGPLASL